jgi:hypothetical protein
LLYSDIEQAVRKPLRRAVSAPIAIVVGGVDPRPVDAPEAVQELAPPE